MPRKRAIEEADEEVSTPRRQTRSATIATKSTVDVDRGSFVSLRKRHRETTPDSEPENNRELRSPTPLRTYFRRRNVISRTLKQGEALEHSTLEELSLGTTPPRNTRRCLILDAVEIVTKARVGSGKHGHRELEELVLNSDPPKTNQIETKVLHSPNFQNHRIQKKTPSLKFSGEIPKVLPEHFHECLERQKQAVLNVFHDPSLVDDRDENADLSANAFTLEQLTDLLGGSIERGEGNSCLLIGPSGSGKSKIFETASRRYKEDYNPIVVRLNGYVQHTDRLAIREIARQIVDQTGSKTFQSIDMDDDDNPFDDGDPTAFVGSLPPPSHLPSLIAALPTLPRPVVVLLDAFNIFTEQPRQALLYCLLDTVQSCRSGSSSHRGLAVVGLTTRIDVVNFLEKRVKSRFSHRTFRTASPNKFEDSMALLRRCLYADAISPYASATSEWRSIWEHSVDAFLQDQSVKETFKDMFGVSRDIRRLLRMMTSMILRLEPSSPYLTIQNLWKCLEWRSGKAQGSSLFNLNYPSLSLCIAAQHARTAGHDSFTFEMLYDLFATQVRTSSAAPVMLGGGSIGMVNISRRTLMGAFEELIQMKIFVQTAPSASSVGRQFIKYRCAVEWGGVKAAVDCIGQTSLKKWFSKLQQ
ncbi:ORC4 [Sanghuangporus sanghuang]